MKTVSVKVQFPAWAETSYSWRLLTVRSENKKGWSSGEWFSKKECALIESEREPGVGILTMPVHLFVRMSDSGVKFTNMFNAII